MARHDLTRASAALALLLAAAGCAPVPDAGPAAEVAPAEMPSILLVTLDTTRADAMGYESNEVDTPAFDRLAGHGLRFDQAYATAPMTLPSHASMLTGLYPAGHGVRENARFLDERHPLAAERLAERGYRTAAVVSGYPLAARFGLARGFASYEDRFGGEAAGEGAAERDAAETTRLALAALAATGVGDTDDRPLFLWVHYFDPHEPYEPPEPFRSRYEERPYLGEVAFMDREAGRLIDAFRTRHAGRPHRVVVAGDHGEGLGEHGEALHGNLLYQGVMRVPLIVAGDGIGAGRVAHPVSVRRIFDSLLAWAGDGEAVPLERRGPEVVLGEAMKPHLQYGWQPQVMAVSGTTKLIRSGEIEVYDLAADPGESENLEGRATVDGRLQKALLDYPFVPEPAAASADDERLTAADRERLASLGYVSWEGAATLPRPDAPSPRRMTHLFRALDLGSGLFVQRRYAEAIPLFEEVRRQDPGNLMVTLRLAVAHSSLGRDRRALELFAAARRLAPESVDVRHYLAMHLFRAGLWAEAEPLLRQVVAAQPRRLPALESLSEILERTNRPGEAAALVERIVPLTPEPAAALSRLGDLRMALADTPGAVRAFERARELAGDAFDRHLELGVCYLADRRYPEARDSLDRALASLAADHPAHPMALFKRAQVSVLLGEPDRGERIRAARRGADGTTRTLIDNERLFEGVR